ncbi:hypothetical protein GA0074692_5448 [Micromonospora pallida]|uniref:Uncharacterized protein n=1 Tax=Micromonospora pallida TaxID=145854 RepID=A0A1C6TDV2_9ACTN|nr:DUF6114 domain-containing protein [Micromonospora pallida]SCL39683.1 hypothetical protein GA0074692_5448 [Micromonospora pallida]
MTSADPQHARPGGFSQTRWRFRQWRRSRPFWGGLLTVLAGVQIFGTTQMSLGGLTFQMGPTGFLSWLIPTILVACGVFMWFTPQYRMFYAVVAAVTAVFSLIGVNLGGFFVGMLLGMVGSALGFAWTPARAASPPASPDREPPTTEPGQTTVAGQPAPAGAALPGVPESEDLDRTLVDEIMPVERDGGASLRDPRFLAGTVALLGLGMATLLALNGPTPVRAAPVGPDCPSPTVPVPSGTPVPSTTPGDGTPDPGATVPTRPAGNLLTATTGEPTRSPAPTMPATRPATPRPASPAPPVCVTPTPNEPDEPDEPEPAEPGRPLPRIDAEPGQPTVASPSKLTGSKVVMTGIRFEGVVDLKTIDGTLRALKFSMRRAVTDDFTLLTAGPAGQLRYVTDQLTVDGDVAFYATRFTGRISLIGGPGLITVTLTPDLPFPDGIPITAPQLVFQDPVMDLAFLDCDAFTTGDNPLRVTPR